MVGSGNKCAKSGVIIQSTVVLLESIAVLIWLNSGVSSNDFCVAEPRFWHIFYLTMTLPPPKGNISTLKLAMVTNEVACIVKQKNTLCNDIQHNTSHFQITPEIYGFKNIKNFLS